MRNNTALTRTLARHWIRADAMQELALIDDDIASFTTAIQIKRSLWEIAMSDGITQEELRAEVRRQEDEE